MLESHTDVVQQLGIRGSRLKEVRLVTALLQVHDGRRLEMLAQLFLALDTAVNKLADFLRVKARPHVVMEFLVKFEDEERVDKVDEGVAHTAPVLEIHREVQKIVPSSVVLVDFLR